jgi:GNAT superfamily N-acetyltransferase
MTLVRAASVVSTLRRMPAIVVFHKLARLVPFRPVDAGRLRFLRLGAAPSVAPSMLRGRVVVRRGTAADLPDLAALQDKRAVFASRFAGGDHCVVAVANGRIVGYEWFCAGPVHRESEWNYPIAIPAGAVYAYDAYVDPAYRNGGVWLRFKSYLGDWMAASGRHEVITFVEEGNVASWRTHIRFGFTPAKTVLALRLFGVMFFFTTAG